MPSPHIPLTIDIDLISQRADLLIRLRHELPNPSQHISQIIISHRPARFSKVGYDNGHLVVVGQDVRVGEETARDELFAFSVEGFFKDDGEGDAEALEQVAGWDFGAEGVEEEAC